MHSLNSKKADNACVSSSSQPTTEGSVALSPIGGLERFVETFPYQDTALSFSSILPRSREYKPYQITTRSVKSTSSTVTKDKPSLKDFPTTADLLRAPCRIQVPCPTYNHT